MLLVFLKPPLQTPCLLIGDSRCLSTAILPVGGIDHVRSMPASIRLQSRVPSHLPRMHAVTSHVSNMCRLFSIADVVC